MGRATTPGNSVSMAMYGYSSTISMILSNSSFKFLAHTSTMHTSCGDEFLPVRSVPLVTLLLGADTTIPGAEVVDAMELVWFCSVDELETKGRTLASSLL